MKQKKDNLSSFGHAFSDFEMLAIIVNDNKMLKKRILDRLQEAKSRALTAGGASAKEAANKVKKE